MNPKIACGASKMRLFTSSSMLAVLLFYRASRVPNVMLAFKYRQGRRFLYLKDPRHALYILKCYQHDIPVSGEGSPASINFKSFFQRGSYAAKGSLQKGATIFDTIFDFMTGCR